MRTKKSKPRIGERDIEVAHFILEHKFTEIGNVTPSEVAEHFEFTRQSGDYYLKRLVMFKFLRNLKGVNRYKVVRPLSDPFDILE